LTKLPEFVLHRRSVSFCDKNIHPDRQTLKSFQVTFEKRMEFLRQSIESHDRQIGELTDQIASVNQKTASLDAQLATLGYQIASWGKRAEAFDDRLDRFAELTQLNFDRLTKAMTGLTDLVANHERRLGKLEEGHDG